MARPGDAHFLGVLSAHPGEPGRESCLWSVGVAGAQAHISPPVGLELSRLSGWGQELVAQCESEIEAKDPLRQNNRQNAKPNSRQKIPKPRPNGVKARSRGHASAPRSHTARGHCARQACVFPGMLPPTSFPEESQAAPVHTGRLTTHRGHQLYLSLLIVGEQSKSRFLGYTAFVI